MAKVLVIISRPPPTIERPHSVNRSGGCSERYTAMKCIVLTGKNDLTRRVTHREAVFGTAIHSIFDAWHYDVLWTYVLTRLL